MALRRSDWANARNVSFRITLRWPIHIINPVDKTKLSCNTPHRRSTTVSLESYRLYLSGELYYRNFCYIQFLFCFGNTGSLWICRLDSLRSDQIVLVGMKCNFRIWHLDFKLNLDLYYHFVRNYYFTETLSVVFSSSPAVDRTLTSSLGDAREMSTTKTNYMLKDSCT